MKYFLNALILLVAGCAQLQHGQAQPVVSKFSKEKGEYHFTSCSGAVEDWASCYSKARNTCPKGYVVIEQTDNANGGFRNLTFQCK